MPASIASVGMSSTAVRQRANHSRSSGLQGASANPQLPMITVVTPCQQEQLPMPVPGHLRVHVGVAVDEARRDDQAVGVDRALGRRADAADLDDPAMLDADVGAIARGARAVDDRPVANQQIQTHGVLSRGSCVAPYYPAPAVADTATGG